MGVSENGGFSSKSSHFNKVFHYFHHPFWGTTILGNPHLGRSSFLLKHTRDLCRCKHVGFFFTSLSEGCFLKWWYPNLHPKMTIFSRETHGCWVPHLFSGVWFKSITPNPTQQKTWSMCVAVGKRGVPSSLFRNIPKEDALCRARFDQLQ